MHAGHWLGGHRFVRIAGQRAPTAFAAQTALAWSDMLGFLRLVRASVPSTTAGWNCPGFSAVERRNPCRQALHLRPQRMDQGVLLGVAQSAEIGR
jgi:hypothetical protein